MDIYDLTGKLENGMWEYGTPFVPYSLKRISSMEKDGYIASELVLTTHTGTHVDCPRHFGEERRAIDMMDLKTFYGEAMLVDVSSKCGAKVQITKEMLKACGAEELKENDICVLKTGWFKMWNKKEYEEDYPYLTPGGAEYLVSKKIKMLAMDIPIIGDPDSTEADMVLCECETPSVYALVNLNVLPKRFTFAAFPLNLAVGDGSPVRAVAIV